MNKTIALIFVLVAGFVNNANASWQSCVDDNLVGTGSVVAKGAIFGQDSSIWAISPDFNLSTGEMTAMVNAFTDSTAIIANGLFANGVKYMVLRADSEEIIAKKGPISACVRKTIQAVVLGVSAEGQNPNSVVGSVADYLIGSGY